MQKNLCITSKSPGRTQRPYHYGLLATKHKKHNNNNNNNNNIQGYVVDLPGYGFGQAPKSVVEDWQGETQDWLLKTTRLGHLRRLFLLLDARRDQPSELDRTVMRWLEDADIPYTIVLTKADRVSVPMVVKQVNDFCLRYAADTQQIGGCGTQQSPVIHVTSSKRGWGISELRLAIETEFFGAEDDDIEPRELVEY
jgi:GTP-binding protein